jgi:hypothetical protein
LAQRVGRREWTCISHIDYEACNDLDDGDIMNSVMLTITVRLSAVEIVAKTPPAVIFWVGKVGSVPRFASYRLAILAPWSSLEAVSREHWRQ